MQDGELTQRIIGCAIEVHRYLGPGLLESVYEEALCHELRLAGLTFARQQRVPIHYKGALLAAELRLDLLVEKRVVVDVKAKEALSATDRPQLLTYLRLCDVRVGLIINFHVVALRQGIARVINGYEQPSEVPVIQ